MKFKIAIVGGGPAGIGLGILLKQLGINDFVILEKDKVGSTFYKWPKEMKFITPSFTGHGFGMLDMNAIAPDTSPAYTFQKEHISGEEYGEFLNLLASHFELPVMEEKEVSDVQFNKNGVSFKAGGEEMSANCLVWATGEYQTPNDHPFEGAEYCLHNSRVDSWEDIKGDEVVVIGGYESGMDAAYHLVQEGKQVTIISRSKAWDSSEADPSLVLSPYTSERAVHAYNTGRLTLRENLEVLLVKHLDGYYNVYLSDGTVLKTKTKPILATGFKPGASKIANLFEWGEDGSPLLTEHDESTIQKNLFLIGPNVRHKQVIFCFIYKFRQRFAVVAQEMIDRLELEHHEAVLEKYRRNQMYLDDLSCCEVSCEC